MADQQFCLRWNNHQNTLISVFDTLLEGEILVDCTLAAEGKFLRAHKVVLSACSPFFSDILRQHYEQHPILIMKDVKFSQLKAMLDYMYRGEVNISQDQLGTFLKAAESLQIKGLSDSAPSENLLSKQKSPNESRALCLSSKPDDDISSLRSSNLSPIPRRKKRRRPSGSGDDMINEDIPSEQHQVDNPPPPPKIAANTRLSNPPSPTLAPVDENAPPLEEASRLSSSKSHASTVPVYSKSEMLHQQPTSVIDNILYEPKSECIELDDESFGHDEDNMEAGPSHCKSDGGGFGWQMDQPEDTFSSQESLSGQRSAQGSSVHSARFKLAHALQHLTTTLQTQQHLSNSTSVMENLAANIGQAVEDINQKERTQAFLNPFVNGASKRQINKRGRPKSPKKRIKPKLNKFPNLDVNETNKIWLVPKIELRDIKYKSSLVDKIKIEPDESMQEQV